ncbi:MAG: DUF4153 domain-containing protein [Tissierellaceae bacterium]|jgi:hypothetical protein|nr:DUF4153 domain-containing protein [Tissierellia bacterium]
MKFLYRLRSIFQGIKQSSERFPITISISTLLTVLLIYFNENLQSMASLQQERWVRLNMTLGMGILLSLCLDLLKENFFKDDKRKTFLTYLFGLVVLGFNYMVLLEDFNIVSLTRYIGMMIFLLIVFFYVPVIWNKDRNYELRVIDIFGSIFETAIYSLVLLLGIFAIIFTIDSLFDIDIEFKLYYYIFLIVFFIFAISFFLSKLPRDGETFDKKNYSQSMRILLTYIVIPLISVYTLILYVYFAKILITWEWPKGLVSHLVVWYTAISIGVLFLITPLLETDKISRYFKTLFPKLVLPILLMMFLSIGQRINQYGVTENRYYVLVFGIWIALIMIYFSIKKPLKNLIIPISLSLVVLNSVIGPLSSYSISKYSQNKRLEDILNSNSMISGNNIVRKADISDEDKTQISNIIYYFDNKHSLDDVKLLPNDFDTENMVAVFGFEYNPNIWGTPTSPYTERYFHHNIYLAGNPIDIASYDYYLQLASWINESIPLDDILIKDPLLNLSMEREDEVLISLNIEEVAMDIVTRLGTDPDLEKAQNSPEEMTYEHTGKDLKIKIIFTTISGVVTDEEVEIQSIEYILLIDDLNKE